jgi:predicted ATPase
MQRIKRIVISGSPGAGKTSIIMGLKDKGYSVIEEFSRSLIKDTKAQKPNLFLSDPVGFSKNLLTKRERQYEASEKLVHSKQQLVFYDRGLHDIYAYLKAIDNDTQFFKKKIYSFKYDLVFLARPWKEIFKRDSERLESFEQAKMYYPFIKKTYKKHHKVIELPEVSIEKRIFFIESFIKKYG